MPVCTQSSSVAFGGGGKPPNHRGHLLGEHLVLRVEADVEVVVGVLVLVERKESGSSGYGWSV